MVVTDIERNDVDFIARTLGCQPVAHVDTLTADKLGSAQLCSEVLVLVASWATGSPPSLARLGAPEDARG